MKSTNININGKEIKQEDIDKAIQMFKEKFGDLEGSNFSEIIASLEKKNFQGKILANVAKNLLNDNNMFTDTTVNVIHHDKSETIKMDEINATKPINASTPLKIMEVNAVKKISVDPQYKSSNLGINIHTPLQNTNPFVTVLVYLVIAGIITAIIYFVKVSFGF